MKFIALDFETANFKRESICSIGLTFVEDSQVVKTFKKLVKPTPFYFEHINMSIHGITAEQTQNERTFAEAWEEIKPMINKQQVIAHNASFDFSALRAILEVNKLSFPDLEYFCSMLLSKKVFPGLINYQLPTICNSLNIHGLKHHDCVSDAHASARVMLNIFQKANESSFEGLERRLLFSPGRLFPNSYFPFSCHVQSIKQTVQSIDLVFPSEKLDTGHPFFNKNIVFTGTISKLPRNDAKQIVTSIGGKTPSGLNRNTNFLVVGTYDYDKFGKGFKSSKLIRAEELIEKGQDLEIISEMDFLKMIHSEKASYEITLDQIKTDSEAFLKRNKYNDFSGKQVYFTSDLSIPNLTAFQHVGDCGGYGHDYDTEEIPNSDYFIIADRIIIDLENGIKHKSILDFEQIRSIAQNRGDVKSIKILSEKTFLEYIDRRKKFQKNEFKMNIHEWEVV